MNNVKLFLSCYVVGVACQAVADDGDWPSFRGQGAIGVADGYETPLEWDATAETNSNLQWKTQVPGLGHSCPVVVGNQIFLATAKPTSGDVALQIGRGGNIKAANDETEQSWMVLCYDRATGDELWRQTAHTGLPKATRHTKATHANATVSVEGDNVVAFFGSEGLYCYSLAGKLKWKKDLGVVDVSKYGIGWGYASSPSISSGTIVLVCDDPANPYVVALKLETGEELWRTSREGDCERSWGTPLICQRGEGSQVVVNGWPWIVSYDLACGQELWRIEGGGDNPVPSPFLIEDRIYVTNSHGGKSPIVVVRSDAKGNISESEDSAEAGLIWRTERGGSYMSTPVVVGDYIYLGNTNGVLRCFHALNGEKIYEERIDSGAYMVASLVAANERIYCTAEDGTVYVVKAGPEFEILARNQLGEPCLSTPAISKGTFYFRTTESLMAIVSPAEKKVVEQPQSSASPAGSKKPNVLFIAVDDLRPSLGCYGDHLAVSPNIDRLAAEGVMFNRAYCQVAVCNPSRASLMTGLRPDTLGVWTLPIHFREARPDAVTIPQWLRRFGYSAVSHGKIFHNPTPDPQSWSEPIRPLPRLPAFYPKGTQEVIRNAQEKLPQRDWRKNNLRGPATAAPDLPDNKVLDGARTDMCIADLKRLAKSEKPFFLAMGYIRPHLSFVAPQRYWDMYDAKQLPVLSDQTTPGGAPVYAMHNNSELSHYVDLIDMPRPWDDTTLDEDRARRLVHGYYACVSFVDAQIGRLLDALEEEGLSENTIVVLWSDHGWKLGEYRGWGKMTNYEIDTRVPLIISAPGIATAGASTDSLAELLDLYPTLCELTGVDVPAFAEGTSLVPILRDPKKTVRDTAVSQYYRRHEGQEYMGYSLRTDRYRYIEWRDFDTGERVERELYDHEHGDVESRNQIDSADPGLISDLERSLQSTHAPLELQMTPSVHSNPAAGRWKSDLTFRNQSASQIMVYPITPQGRRGRVRKVETGKSHTFNARIGGTYVVESLDGTIHQIHSPHWPADEVVIDGPGDRP